MHQSLLAIMPKISLDVFSVSELLTMYFQKQLMAEITNIHNLYLLVLIIITMQEALKFKLSLAGIQAHSLQDFSSGLLLYDLMLNKLPQTDTLLKLQGRLKKTIPNQSQQTNKTDMPESRKMGQPHKANNIININILLKYIKSQSYCPEKIQSLTAFALEDEKKIKQLVEWLLTFEKQQDSLDESKIQIDIQYQDSYNIQSQKKTQHKQKHHQSSDQLSNLYFVSQNNKQNNQEEFSLNIPKEETVKGNTSVKVLKPKTNFSEDSFLSLKEHPFSESVEKPQKLSMPPRPNIPPLPKNSHRGDQSPSIIYKQFQKSPMISESMNCVPSYFKTFQNSEVKVSTTARSHRQNNQRNKDVQSPMFQTKRSSKLKQLQKEVNLIQKSIGKQKREIVSIRRNSKSTKKKPVQITEVSEFYQQQIIQWLISINLLNSLARNKKKNLPLICKKGVIFPQLINQKKQRTDPEIKYQAKPTKSAQIHANYKRVFDHLSKLNNFTSNLLYSYQNFVPQVPENVFWAFLLDLMNYYKSCGKKKAHSVSKFVDQDINPLPPPMKTEREDYNKIKFSFQRNSSSKNRQHQIKQNQEESDDDYKERPLRNKIGQQNNMVQSRIDTNNSLVSISSYQQLRIKKMAMTDTPRRSRSIQKNLDSIEKVQQSRLSLKSSKVISVDNIPEVTPEMQSAALAYLKEQYSGIDVQSLLNFKQMFEDPIRNGTLLMLVICRHFNLKAQQFIIKPTTINNCRTNLNKALDLIKSKQPNFPSSYLNSTESILKGQKSIFYGIVYHLTNQGMSRTQVSLNQSFLNLDMFRETILNWINSLKPQFENMKYVQFDTFESVIEHMSSGILLNQLSSLATKRHLKLVYDKPQYHVQYRANIMKALQPLIEKEVIQKQFLWKAKKISTGDVKTIVTLLDALRKKLSSFVWAKNNAVSFQQLVKAYCTR